MATKLKKELMEENEMLLTRLEKLERLLERQIQTKEDTYEASGNIIPMTKIVKVVSLYNGILNLKTTNNSDGMIFKFNFFGDEQPLFYSDLVKCIAIQQRFFKDGFCMILDKEIVKAHYLEKDYKNLLTKDEIENFLDLSEEEMKLKFDKIPNQQRITVIEIIANNLNKSNIIDRNKVDIISKISGQDIIKIAEKIK
jgi:hypothetical protein